MFSQVTSRYPVPAVIGLVLGIVTMPGIVQATELQGRWVGYYECANMQRNYFILDIADNSARFEMPDGVLNVAGTVGSDKISLQVQQWVTKQRHAANTVMGIAGEYIDAAGVMTGEVETTGRLQCRSSTSGRGSAAPTEQQLFPRFIAARAGPVPSRRENPNGLLFKVTDNIKSGRELPPAECARYAQFLQSGKIEAKPNVAGSKIHTAVLDDELMLDVLGRDLNSITAADFPRIRTIARSCKNVLVKSNDPTLIQQANAVRIWNAPPLNKARNINIRNWIVAIAAMYYRDIVDPLPNIAMRIDEGLYGSAPAAVAQATPEGLNSLWHGYYQCGPNEYYMRLNLNASGGRVDGTFESSSSIVSRSRRGILKISGTETTAGQFSVEPTGWEQQAGSMTPMGFKGVLSNERLTGQMTGSNGQCSTFSVRRLVIDPLPKNPDGLLFKVDNRSRVQLEPADCRKFANWLASGEQLMIGGQHFNSIGFDQAAANEVLGKSASSWGKDDHGKFNSIALYCAQFIRNSFDAGDRALAAQINVWAPAPFSKPKFNQQVSDWLLADQILLVTTEAEELATAQLDEIRGLASGLAGLDRINEMLNALAKKQGRFKYMPNERQVEHRDALLAERDAFGGRVAQALAAGYADYPQTFDGFRTMAAQSKHQQKLLIDRGEPSAANKLAKLYGAEAARRGSLLLPEMITLHRATLTGELANAGYASMPVLRELDVERQNLADYWLPSSNDPLYADYQAYIRLRDDTAMSMVSRSQGALVEWVEALPPSKTSNDRLDEFVVSSFRTNSVPSKYADLKKSIADKKSAYNPDRYRRPDISLALVRGHYGEMKYQGLEYIAYMTTILREMRDQCPAEIDQATANHEIALSSFIWTGSMNAVERIMRGEVESRAEAERFTWLMINGIFNSPGCRVDMFGFISNCTSQEEHQAANDQIMTSSEALADGPKLIAKDCSGYPPKFIQNLVTFVRTSPYTNPPQPVTMPESWEFVVNR